MRCLALIERAVAENSPDSNAGHSECSIVDGRTRRCGKDSCGGAARTTLSRQHGASAGDAGSGNDSNQAAEGRPRGGRATAGIWRGGVLEAHDERAPPLGMLRAIAQCELGAALQSCGVPLSALPLALYYNAASAFLVPAALSGASVADTATVYGYAPACMNAAAARHDVDRIVQRFDCWRPPLAAARSSGRRARDN